MMNFLIVVSIILLSTSQVFGVDWHEETSLFWAFGCDWSDNDLSSKKGPGEQCGSNCEQTAGCTHFTWTDYEGGTCWMKKNEVSKNQATGASGSAVCGIMKSATSGGGGGEGGISWHDDADVSWAEMCDFVDNDLSSKKVPGEQCSNTCKGTGGCTHFAWTNYEGGTCWMKKNGATKDQTKKTTEYSVCGIMKSVAPPTGGTEGMSDKEVFAKTIYGEARGEPDEGQKWVAWVIKNRARLNRDFWGGSSIKNVCLKPGQFECWNGVTDIVIDQQDLYNQILAWSSQIFDAPSNEDPTGGCDHYNNPDKEGFPPWTFNVVKIRKIANHQFYKGP